VQVFLQENWGNRQKIRSKRLKTYFLEIVKNRKAGKGAAK